MPFTPPRLLAAVGHTRSGRLALFALITLVLAGCDVAGLPIGAAQCTPQTCDYVVNSLVAAKSASGVALFADSTNAFYSFDGTKWQKIGAEVVTQRGQIFASPNFAADQTLFLGNSTSADGGKTWSLLCAVVTAVSPNFGTDKTVFGVNALVASGGTAGSSSSAGPPGCPSTEGPYYVSTDGAQSWKPGTAPTGAGRPDLFVLSASYASDKTIFATFSVDKNQQPAPALYRSTNGGTSWTQVLTGKFNVLALSPNGKTVAVVSADKGQLSTNGGSSWQDLKLPIPVTQVAEIAFSPNYASDKTLILASAAADTGTTTKGTYVSTDAGATWNHTGPAGQRGQNFPALVFSPNYASDKTLYASSLDQGQGPAKSADLGANWTAINSGLDLVAGLGG